MKTLIDPPHQESAVVENYQKYYRRFLRQTRSPSVASDLCQELWLKVTRHIHRHGQPENEEFLANIAASSVLKDWWRSERRFQAEALPDDDEGLAGQAAVPSRDELADANWQAAVRRTLREVLPSDKQEQVLLAEECDGETLAARFGSTPSAIRTCRYKLLQRLRNNPRLQELWQATLAA